MQSSTKKHYATSSGFTEHLYISSIQKEDIVPLRNPCNQNHNTRNIRTADIDVFHAKMVEGATFTGKYDLPAIRPTSLWPNDVISFPEAMASNCHEYEKVIHFYCDDFRFERLWRSPERYVDKIGKFAGIIGPDFSTCPNFPLAETIHNTYRNAACTYWFQKMEFDAIPNVRCEVETADWALSYIPHNGVIAIGSHGCIKNHEDRMRFVASLKIVVDSIKPKGIVVIGSAAYGVFDYPKSLGIPIKVYPLGLGGHRVGAAYEL